MRAVIQMIDADTAAAWQRRTINVADPRLGARALFATDDFFAPKERMLQPGEPEWRAGVYDDHGKWMDGWESRRRREGGHDYCIVALASLSHVSLLEIDTRHFTGNYPPFASVEACRSTVDPDAGTAWTTLLPQAPLQGDQRHFFAVDAGTAWTHLKLNIHPDGGVARFRSFGRIACDWSRPGQSSLDLAAALNGGRALACSDEHYGSMHNVLLPGRGTSMADGWETRRRRTPGFDWVILELGTAGVPEAVEIDTAYFKGNFPHQVSIQATLLPSTGAQGVEAGERGDIDLSTQCLYWPVLLEPRLLQADQVHRFALQGAGAISHLRVNIHPDGGVSRVRVFGKPSRG
jgi:allantoicase